MIDVSNHSHLPHREPFQMVNFVCQEARRLILWFNNRSTVLKRSKSIFITRDAHANEQTSAVG
jgi:hypothetical protein